MNAGALPEPGASHGDVLAPLFPLSVYIGMRRDSIAVLVRRVLPAAKAQVSRSALKAFAASQHYNTGSRD
jgi:hypothetical protein